MEEGEKGAALPRVPGDMVCLGEGFLVLLGPSSPSTLVGSQGVPGGGRNIRLVDGLGRVWTSFGRCMSRPQQIEQDFDDQGGSKLAEGRMPLP